MTIVHLVQFGFKETVPEDVVKKCVARMCNLRFTCLDPETKKPYLMSVLGGINNSPESHANGLTHGFVVTIRNEEEREYYLNKDPAHLAFVEEVKPLVDKVCVVDFCPGKY